MRLIDTFSHAVGTARFARTPEEGVLSPECRVWGFPNLFVVDGSFMPTSGGVNPSLTITANAFRVAAHIRRDFGAIAVAWLPPLRGARRSDRDRARGFGAVARQQSIRGVHVRKIGEDVFQRTVGRAAVVDRGEEVAPHRLVAGCIADVGQRNDRPVGASRRPYTPRASK